MLVATLEGNGRFSVPVVGESRYQSALEAAAGGRSPEGANERVPAVLVFEPENPVDALAVCVKISGRTVGYLDRAFARSFRKQIAAQAAGFREFRCQAVIRGGWDRGGDDRGHFGVWLDIDVG